MLTTSGIDGVYPAGLAVATVMSVDTKTSDAFARILCTPTAGVSRHRQLLLLLGDSSILPPPPPAEEENPERTRRSRKETAE